jgi:hypothetical protein
MLSTGVIISRRDARLRRLGGIGPLLQGSISTIAVRCGNPSCCCARGDKHVSHVLTMKVSGKTRTVYVPSGMLKEARKWSRQFKLAKRLMKEISDLNVMLIRNHVSVERAKRRNLEGNKKKGLRK